MSNSEHFCINCFDNQYIKDFIVANGKKNQDEDYRCQYCHIYNPEYLIEHNKIIIVLEKALHNLYQYDSEGAYDDICHKASEEYCDDGESPESFANLLSINDLEGLHDKPEYSYKEIEEIFSDDFGYGHDIHELYQIFEKYKSQNTISCIYSQKVWKNRCLYTKLEKTLGKWRVFSENVKYKARYFDHSDFKVKQYLQQFNSFFASIESSNYETTIYRARIVDSLKTRIEIKNGNKSQQLGKAPKEYAKNNRFSPIGISYGYYCFDKETILDEIRVIINDEIAIGRFKLSDELKILDFRKKSLTQYMNPFNDNFNIDIFCDEVYFLHFTHDISKPISAIDSPLEYVPTQILAEYIWSIGYDGFIFDSSQRYNGENLVLFGENPKCTKCEFVKITVKNIKYSFEITQ